MSFDYILNKPLGAYFGSESSNNQTSINPIIVYLTHRGLTCD